MNKTQLEQDIEHFPFWNMEFQRILHYWRCAQEGNLPWVFIVGVFNNYLNSDVLPSQEGARDISFLRDVAQQHHYIKA